MKNHRNIIFKIGDENRIVVEHINQKVLGTSIFSEPYRYAMDALNSYFKSMPKELSTRLGEEELWRNNIFAFIGDRGSGKTSCMQSIAQFLVDSPKELEDNAVLKERFYKIDMVDPSFVDNDSNVVGVILASLYKKYLEYSSKHTDNEKKRIKLANHFAKVQHDFYRMMECKNVGDDDLEALSSLSAAIDLKQSMLNLIDCFMSYVDKEGAILLIPVDDIDLHSKAATDMVEQIRKYLVLPNVVVLMAVKMSQLSKLKRLQFSKEYQDKRNTLSDTELDEMVEKYITKLVPYGHRIYMPDATFYWDAQLTVLKNDEVEQENVSIRQFIPELIFRKTRYLFYNSSIKTSYIVPDNLRELRQLMRLLYDMNDYFNEVGDTVKEEVNNKMVFKKYLFQSWMMNHLDASSQSLIKELLAVTDSIQMNAFTLRIIRQKFYLKDDNGKLVAPWQGEEKDGIRQELDYVMRKDNMVYNVALGDVLAVIDYLERLDITSEQMYFLFMIKTIYSIRLYEYFLDYTDYLQNSKVRPTEESQNEGQKVLRRKLYEDLQLPDYLKLIAGRVFNTRASLILPVGRKKESVSRSNRVINLRPLNELIQKCIEERNTVSAKTIQMVEFFMLCTARVYRSQNKKPDQYDYYEPNFRTNRDIVYAVSLTRKPNAFFDIASFLYNVIDIKRCYERFPKGKEFYDLVEAGEHFYSESLFKRFQSKNLERLSKEREDGIPARQLKGWFCVRNMEVLKDLTLYLDEAAYKNSGGDIIKLIEFFQRLAKFSIHSYDKESKTDTANYYSIDYSFSEVIVDFLKSISSDEDEGQKSSFSQIFNGYLAVEDEVDDEEYESLPSIASVLETYNGNPLNEEQIQAFITGSFITAKSLKKNIKQQYSVFNDLRLGRILDASIGSSDNSHIKREMVHSIVESISGKINELSVVDNHGNAEANHQAPVHAPEE